MSTEDYQKDAMKTLSNDYTAIRKRLDASEAIDLLHGAAGASTESGELLDMVKRYLFYGAPIDWVNLEEELGDILWYVCLCIQASRKAGHHISWEGVMKKNITKLAKRYPDKFTEHDANNRDLDGERKILEK